MKSIVINTRDVMWAFNPPEFLFKTLKAAGAPIKKRRGKIRMSAQIFQGMECPVTGETMYFWYEKHRPELPNHKKELPDRVKLLTL